LGKEGKDYREYKKDFLDRIVRNQEVKIIKKTINLLTSYFYLKHARN
jgi:hypothetical protein